MVAHAAILVFQHVMKLTMALIWDLLEHRHLFRARNLEHKLDDGYHLAEMQAVLGQSPLGFLARSESTLKYWDEIGLCRLPSE